MERIEDMEMWSSEMDVRRETRDAIKELVEQQKIANQLAAYALAGLSDQDEIVLIVRGYRVVS